MKEEWREIKGFEDRYEVSNLGRVRSKPRYTVVTNKKGTRFRRKMQSKILKPSDNGCGYMHVILTSGKQKFGKYIHRLVCDAFIPNPENLSTVNHISENKLDNRAENLEWMSLKDNINFGTRTERAARTRRLKNLYSKLCIDSSAKKDAELSLLWDI